MKQVMSMIGLGFNNTLAGHKIGKTVAGAVSEQSKHDRYF